MSVKFLRMLLPYVNRIVVIFMVHFYGNIKVIDLENVLQDGINVLTE